MSDDEDDLEDTLYDSKKLMNEGYTKNIRRIFGLQSIWFVFLSLLLLVSPIKLLEFFGWQVTDELSPRIIAFFFMNIGVQSYLMCLPEGHKQNPLKTLGMSSMFMNISILLVFSFGLINDLVDYKNKSSWPGLLFFCSFLFFAFFWIWLYGFTNYLTDETLRKLRRAVHSTQDTQRLIESLKEEIEELKENARKYKNDVRKV